MLVTGSANSGNALIGFHSDIRNRGHRSNRICRIHCNTRMGTRRIHSHSNRKGNSHHRNIRTDSPSPTNPESRSRR
jgi:hypothetical protein